MKDLQVIWQRSGRGIVTKLDSKPKAKVILKKIFGSKWFEDQRVGEVSTRSGRGKHTTRHVSQLPLSRGGYIADTPGFNQPSLLKVTKQSLAQTFLKSGKCLVSMSMQNVHLIIACILVNLAAL